MKPRLAALQTNCSQFDPAGVWMPKLVSIAVPLIL